MKKISIAFVVLFFWLFLREVLAGGVDIDFEIPDPKTKAFAGEFMREMQKKKILISLFGEDYFVRGYLGAMPDEATGEEKSVIGIFINDQKKAVFKIWCDELFSREEIRKKAKKASDYVFEYLKRMDEKRKNQLRFLFKGGEAN